MTLPGVTANATVVHTSTMITSKNITALAVYHHVAVIPRASCWAPGADSAPVTGDVVLIRPTIEA